MYWWRVSGGTSPFARIRTAIHHKVAITLSIRFKTPKLPTMKRLLPFILLFFCSATLAESGAYRVEVIVFRNLEVISEAAEVEKLRSFSQFPDLEEVKLPAILSDGTATQPPQVLNADLPELPRGDLPDDLHVISQKGAEMTDAWRRLRSSKDYMPLVYSAWEQNRTDYYPPMRIHDQQIIDTQLRPPTHIMVAELAAEDPLAAYRSVFYQLDGGIQLRRSRFLHLFLDLEYREMKPQSVRVPGLTRENLDQAEAETESESNTDYVVFALKQNRQVQTGRMNYFDSPHFGVLVLVSAIAVE